MLSLRPLATVRGMRDLSDARVLVAGGSGFVGRAVIDVLKARGCAKVLAPSSAVCNLLDAESVGRWFKEHSPDVVVHCAAKTGGIAWNQTHGREAFRDNLLMALFLIDAAVDGGVQHMTHVSSSIAYPGGADIPFVESELWKGRPSGPTAAYAHAKRLGQIPLELACNGSDMSAAIVMPANVYGAGARVDAARANVVGAMVRRFVHAARDGKGHVVCWGSGTPEREFIHVRDVAEGIVRATERVATPQPINLGTGVSCSIRSLAEQTAEAAGWSGVIEWDTSRPDGVPRVCCNVDAMTSQLNWAPTTSLDDGLRDMVSWYQAMTSEQS